MNLRPRRGVEEPEINLISLIDVVLMMVIFFMVSSTFVDENRLRIRLPEASSAPVARSEKERITVTVTQGGGYRVNDRELVNASALIPLHSVGNARQRARIRHRNLHRPPLITYGWEPTSDAIADACLPNAIHSLKS